MRTLFFIPLVLMSLVSSPNIANAKELNYCSDKQIERCVDGLPFHATAKRIFLGENIVRHCDMDKKIIIYDQFINKDKTYYTKGEEYVGYVCVFQQRYNAPPKD